MYYNSFKDYLIANRNGIEANIIDMNADELRDEVLNSYDFVAAKAIEHFECYLILKEAIIKRYGEEVFRELEVGEGNGCKRLLKAVGEYYADIRANKKVGYSTEE